MSPERTLVIMTRAPVPGRVKTRLIPALGAAGAARVHARLLEQTLRTSRALRAEAAIELHVSPHPGHPALSRLLNAWAVVDREAPREAVTAMDGEPRPDPDERAAPPARTRTGPSVPGTGSACDRGLVLRPQLGADLGERMCRALSGALERSSRAVLIGTDCPGLSAPVLRQAFEVLDHRDAVLGPALDGGYVLIGLRVAGPALFWDIPWGTDRVLELSRLRLRAMGWRWSELEPLRDLDRPDDLLYFPELHDVLCEAPTSHGMA